jgi:thioredoxin 1
MSAPSVNGEQCGRRAVLSGFTRRGAQVAQKTGPKRSDRRRRADWQSPTGDQVNMAEIVDVTDQNFEAEILKSDKPVIIDFWAEWCAPCKQIAPVIKDLAEQYGDRVKIAKMDIDSNPGTPGQYGIRAIPTILSFKDGKVVDQLQGARPKADFEAAIEKLL